MPLRDYVCRDCGFEFEEFVQHEQEPNKCSHCESVRIARLPSALGGYHISGNNAGSTRPRNAGSFKRSLKFFSGVFICLAAVNSVKAIASDKTPRPVILNAIHEAADEADVPYRLLLAICTVESSLNPKAVHLHDGDGTSYGLCQIKEATARDMGFEAKTKILMDIHVNAYYAAKYLAHQMEKYEDDWIRAIAGYNRGSSHFHVSNQEYVNKVLAEAVKE